jgi:putative membrane protein
MIKLKAAQLSLALLLAGSACLAQANDFVDQASAAGVAQIQAGQLALSKTGYEDVKTYANVMIRDYTLINQQLAQLAKQLDIEVPDDNALASKAKEMMPTPITGKSREAAYAAQQVQAQEALVKLFTDEANSTDAPELKACAQENLPTVNRHLKMAQRLLKTYKR